MRVCAPVYLGEDKKVISILTTCIEGLVNLLVALIGKIDPSKKKQSSSDNEQGTASDSLIKAVLLPEFKTSTGDPDCENDIDGMYKQRVQSLQAEDYSSVYFRKFDASIEVSIFKDHIEVRSEYTICFMNPYHIKYIYKRKPVLRNGYEYDTYRWISVLYQDQPYMQRIQKYVGQEQQTPYGNCRFKSGLEVPLIRELTESTLYYSSAYKAEGDGFFYSNRFWNYCKCFNIDVRLTGPEAHKYELRWDLFLSTNRRSSQIARGTVTCNPDHLKLNDYGWIYPSDGYVITITRKV